MNKLSEMGKKLWEKFKALGKTIKIAVIVALVTIIIAIISMIFYSSSNKYAVLYSNLDATDAQMVTQKLTEEGIEMKVQGSSILVPKDKVDQLRIEIAPNLSTSSKGYELMDSESSFGMTDEEFSIKKLRMLQGELEKSIKSLEPVEEARVHITLAEDSVFIKDKTEGKAAVILKLRNGTKLSQEQVQSIVALLSVSTENIPKENIEVLDTNMNLLTKNLSTGEDSTGVSSETVKNHHDMETNYESKLEKQVLELLEPVIGKDKVQAKVNVDLDFDSKKQTQVVVDPNKVIVSQQTITEYNNINGGTTSESPVDNNMSATIEENDSINSSSKEDQTTNYEIGKTETTVISAPGEVKRLTVSVFIDGKLDNSTKADFEKAVGAAIGFDATRGDEISLIGMDFDPTIKEEAESKIEAFNEELAKEKRNNIIKWTLIGTGILVFIIVAVLLLRKRKNKDEEQRAGLDMIIDDNNVNPQESFDPIDFEVKDEKSHIENEIKRYAKEKPEQVADIVKSWLTENER